MRRGSWTAEVHSSIPIGFKKLAFAVHGGFDTIAMDADTIALPKHTLSQLSEVLRNCVACHGSYQVKAAAPK